MNFKHDLTCDVILAGRNLRTSIFGYVRLCSERSSYVLSYHSKRKLLWWFMVEIRRGIRSLWHLLFVCLHFGRDFLSKHFNLKLWFMDCDYDKLYLLWQNHWLAYKPYKHSCSHWKLPYLTLKSPQKVLFCPVKIAMTNFNIKNRNSVELHCTRVGLNFAACAQTKTNQALKFGKAETML